MDIFEKHFLPEIPDQCQKCPALREIVKEIERHDGYANGLQALGHRAMEGTSQDVKGMLHDATGLPDDIINDLTAESDNMLRQMVASRLDHNDDHIAENRFYMVDRITHCTGLLTMRATRDNTEFTVSFCPSSAQEDGRSDIPAQLHIRSAE